MKKGVSHVEIVISFSLFIIFVFFLVFYLNPVRYQDIKPVLLDILQESIRENSSTDFMEFSLVTNIAIKKECFSVNSKEIFKEEKITEKDIRIFDSEKKDVNFSVEGNVLNIEKKNRIYHIYYAEGAFSETGKLKECEKIERANYTIGAPRIEKIVAEEKLERLAEFYKNNYEETKKILNFPLAADFLVNVSSIKKESVVEMKREKPKKVEVAAAELLTDMLRKDGKIEKIILHIEVW